MQLTANAALSRHAILKMQSGETVAVPDGFFRGVSDEPLVWTLLDDAAPDGEFTFTVHYMGIAVYQVVAKLTKKAVKFTATEVECT